MTIMHSLFREGGTITVDHDRCSCCGQCAAICPADNLTLTAGQIEVQDSRFGCIACGHCMMICPENCIKVTGRGLSPEDIVPQPSPQERATPETLRALLLARRSTRQFTADEVDPHILNQIIEMAAMAPMAIPPWDVGCVTVCGRQRVGEVAAEIIAGYKRFLNVFRPWLLKGMRPFIGQAKYEQFVHFIRPLAETYVSAAEEGRDVLLWDAPALLIFHHSAYTDVVDATIPCTYAMLAAESFGLGSTIIGGVPPILQRNRAMCRKLGIPDGHTPALALIVGHPAVSFRRAIRRRFVSTGCPD